MVNNHTINKKLENLIDTISNDLYDVVENDAVVREKARAIMHPLPGTNTRESHIDDVAYTYLRHGMGVIPVWGKGAYKKELEKAPAHKEYTSKNPIVATPMDYHDDLHGEEAEGYINRERRNRAKEVLHLHTKYQDLMDNTGARAMGVIPTRSSGVLIVDVDTEVEKQAFIDWWMDALLEEEGHIDNYGHNNQDRAVIAKQLMDLLDNDGEYAYIVDKPTVSTPGLVENGVTKHSDGGHYYIRVLGDGFDPAKQYNKKATISHNGSQFSIHSEGTYVLAPLSERTEGDYDFTSTEYIALPWVADKLIGALEKNQAPTPVAVAVQGYTFGADTYNPYGEGSTNDRIQRWNERTPWASIIPRTPKWDIVRDHGGNTHDLKYQEASSPVSAQTGDYAIKVYSDTAKNDYPGLKTDRATSKWQFVVATIYGGDQAAAFVGEGIDNREQWLHDTFGHNDYHHGHQGGKKAGATTSGGKNSGSDDDEQERIKPREKAMRYARENVQVRMGDGKRYYYAPKNSVSFSESSETIAKLIRVNSDPDTYIQDTVIKGVINELEVQAEKNTHDEDYIAPEPRLAFHRDEDGLTTYIALENADNEVVRINRHGWEVSTVDNLGDKDNVAFLSSRLLSAIKVDDTDSSIDNIAKIFDYINIPGDKRLLVLAYMIQKLVSGRETALPIMMMTGQPGSGKSTAAELIKRVVDPSPSSLTTLPSSSEEAATKLSGRAITIFDNVGSIPRSISDTVLSPAATKGAYESRKLYTDSEVVIQNIHRSIIITAVDTPSMMSDLRSRTVFIEVEKIIDRMSTGQLHDSFNRALPGIRAALYTLASLVMSDMWENIYTSQHRLTDYICVAKSLNNVLLQAGLDDIAVDDVEGIFDKSAASLEFESQPDIITYMITMPPRGGVLSGRVGEILSQLREEARDNNWDTSTWVSKARSFSTVLQENMTTLKQYYDVEKKDVKNGKGTLKRFTLRWSGDTADDTADLGGIDDFSVPL